MRKKEGESGEEKIGDNSIWPTGAQPYTCAAHIGMGGVKIKKEPRQRDEHVYRIS